MTAALIIKTLRAKANPKNVVGMARFGINPQNTLGVSLPFLRSLAKTIGRDHSLAQKLWATKIHEARILAALIAEPHLVTVQQMEHWVKDFDSWDVCDQVCNNLFAKSPFAWDKAIAWSRRPEEFVKRAGFVLMATLSVHAKKVGDKEFLEFFPYLLKGATDERNFVKKAVSWAVRQIGKRSTFLNKATLRLCAEIHRLDSPAAKWIAAAARRELAQKKAKLVK